MCDYCLVLNKHTPLFTNSIGEVWHCKMLPVYIWYIPLIQGLWLFLPPCKTSPSVSPRILYSTKYKACIKYKTNKNHVYDITWTPTNPYQLSNSFMQNKSPWIADACLDCWQTDEWGDSYITRFVCGWGV